MRNYDHCRTAVRASLALGVATMLLGGCRTTGQRPSGQVQEALIQPEEQLGVDDVFEVRVAGENDMSGLFRVTGDGTVDFPYVGRLQVVNLRSGDVQRMIAERLKNE